MCYGKKRSAILTKNIHAYALAGRAAEIQNSSTFGRENTVLLGASAFIPPNVTNPSEF